MLARRFEAVLTMLLAWVTALSLSLAGVASGPPPPDARDGQIEAGAGSRNAGAMRASLELGVVGLGVTAFHCLFAGRVSSRDGGGDNGARHDPLWQRDQQAPLIDAKGTGARRARSGSPMVDRSTSGPTSARPLARTPNPSASI